MTSERYQNKNRKNQELDRSILKTSVQLFAVEKCLMSRHADWSKIKLVIRDTMNEFIWKKTKRRPMILPIIMDV
jgi:mRNA degradation ribonuclease J1/J2